MWSFGALHVGRLQIPWRQMLDLDEITEETGRDELAFFLWFGEGLSVFLEE